MRVVVVGVVSWLFISTPINMVYQAKPAIIIKPKTRSALHSIGAVHAPDTKVAMLLRTTGSGKSASSVSSEEIVAETGVF